MQLAMFRIVGIIMLYHKKNMFRFMVTLFKAVGLERITPKYIYFKVC